MIRCCEDPLLNHLMLAIGADGKEKENRNFNYRGRDYDIRGPKAYGTNMQVIKARELIKQAVLHTDSRRW